MVDEIAIFKIQRAEATYDNGSLNVRLFYPRNPQALNKRLPGNPGFGIKALENLIQGDLTNIASVEAPLKPVDSGSMYVFSDGAFLVHRRDMNARVHKMYHSASGGYTDTVNSTFSEDGLLCTGLRESAEENLLITLDNPSRLIVPNDSREYTLTAAKTLNINLKPVYVDVDTLSSRDTLDVFYEDGEHIFSSNGKGFLDLMWDDSTSISLMQIRMIPFSSQEVLPVDAEGMINGGRFKHFNRESYLIFMTEIADKRFGTPLENPRVFQTRFEDSIPFVYTPEYSEPFFGPDGKKVTHPHIWAPENHTTVCLDALGVKGYSDRRLEIELWKNRCKLSGRSMIPNEFLVA